MLAFSPPLSTLSITTHPTNIHLGVFSSPPHPLIVTPFYSGLESTKVQKIINFKKPKLITNRSGDRLSPWKIPRLIFTSPRDTLPDVTLVF